MSEKLKLNFLTEDEKLAERLNVQFYLMAGFNAYDEINCKKILRQYVLSLNAVDLIDNSEFSRVLLEIDKLQVSEFKLV